MKKIVICLFVYLFIGKFCLAEAQTPEPINLTASPTSFDLFSQPGQTLSEKIRIRNNTASAVALKISLKKLIPDTSGKIILEDFRKEDSYQNWLTIQNATVSARPKEWTDIPFVISLPNNAVFGYYWAILISVDNPPHTVKSPQTQITGALAVPILLAIHSDKTIFGGKLLAFLSGNAVYEYLPVEFSTTFQNTSNVHIKPQGNIFISDWTNKQVASLITNPEQGSMLPKEKRVFTTTWNDSFITQDANGTVHLHLDRLRNFRIGKYTATQLLVISGDKKDISFEQTTSFWVIPWKLLLGICIFVFLAGLGLWNTLHTLWKHAKNVLGSK